MRHTKQRAKPTNDPFKLQEDFLANLEKVATERNSRVVLLLDSADRFRVIFHTVHIHAPSYTFTI